MIEERVASPIVNTEPTQLQVSEDTVVVGGGVVETADPIINTPATDNVVDIISVKEVKDLIEDKVGDDIRVPGNVEVGGELRTNTITTKSGNTITIGDGGVNKNLDIKGNLTIRGTTYAGQLNPTNINAFGNVLVGGNLGQPISQNDYLENLASNLSISEFECYKIGQYIKLHAKITLNSGNYTAGDKIADVKTAYKPKYTVVHNNAILYWQWGAITSIATSGNIDCKSTTSTTNANTTIDVFYQIA